ncbi:MAG TPA: arylamine N-acetyltransferase [Terriglobia bacterium]|nr:arylamine N-acetyltransferase [Terriglobia bacterium]
MSGAFDIAAYFERVGFSDAPATTLETLRRLHLLHPAAIPFENLNPLLGWPVPLDSASLQEKLIRRRRGGYCYEQNGLFRNALETLGFDVVGLAARVLWNQPDGATLPRTHMLLRVRVSGEDYLVDVGFGGLTLTAPLRLETGRVQSTPHESFRIEDGEGDYILQARLGDDWKSLYRFTLEPQLMPDYEMANWYVSCHPKSRFVHSLMAARAAHDRRYALLDREFTVRRLDGPTERRILETVDDLLEVLAGPFGVALPAAPELQAALERIIQS